MQVTDKALQKAREFRAADSSVAGKDLRVAIKGGGCSGFQYSIIFDHARDTDEIVRVDLDIKVIVDPVSMQFLADSTLDYLEGLNGSGFKITNPNAKSTCGCGSSFS